MDRCFCGFGTHNVLIVIVRLRVGLQYKVPHKHNKLLHTTFVCVERILFTQQLHTTQNESRTGLIVIVIMIMIMIMILMNNNIMKHTCTMTTDNRHPTSDIRHPTSDNRHPTSDIRQPTTDNQQPTTDNR